MTRLPTPAEQMLKEILLSLNGGVLKGKFHAQHVVKGRWIVDFFFFEIRLAIEVDGSFHDSPEQRKKDREKEAECRRSDMTLLRLTNSEVFGDREALVQKLRDEWRAALHRRRRTQPPARAHSARPDPDL